MVLAFVVAALIGGCSAVRDFLIPPPEGGGSTVNARPRPEVAHLLIRDVVLPDGETSSVAVRSGKIVAIGASAALAARVNSGTAILDGAGGALTPGLVDGHVHLEGWALLGDAIDLRGIQSLPALVATLKARDGLVPSGGWLWGFGLRPELAKLLTAAGLQGAVPDLPVWLSTADGHSAVLSASLISRLPSELIANAKQGHLTEVDARRAWYALPPPAGERLKAFIVQALRKLGKQGVTTIHVMGARPELQTTLEELDAAGRLRVRCRLYLAWPAPTTPTWLSRRLMARAPRRRASTPLLAAKPTQMRSSSSRLIDIAGVKLWLDGTLGARSASLSKPYSDAPAAALAQPLMSVVELAHVIRRADQAGVQVAVHAIGDAALDRLLDALEGLRRPATAWPVRIEHAQVVRPDQLERMGRRSDLLCSVQPLHRTADAAWSALRLGAARVRWGYRAATLNRVCPLIAGSDAPVSAPAPWRAMVALTRHDRAAERMSPADALVAHTREPRTRRARVIAVGAVADLVLWSKRPAPGARELPTVRTLILGGALMRP